MTGLPFVIEKKAKPLRFGRRELVGEDAQPAEDEEALEALEDEIRSQEIPIIASTALRRPLRLSEIADANVVARPKPSFGQRVLSGFEAVGGS